MSERSPHALFRYAFAFMAIASAATILRIPGIIEGDDNGTFILVSFFAILVSAWYGGFGPGLVATGLIVLLTLHPNMTPGRLVRLVLFLACGATTSTLLEALHGAKRRAETIAKEIQQLVASITDHAIFTTDRQGHVTGWSPGAKHVLGYPEADVLGQNMSLFARPASDWRDPPPALGVVTDDSQERELTCSRKDGTRFSASAVVTPLPREDAPGFTWVVRDVTPRKQAEAGLRAAKEAAEQAGRARDQFLAALSHELRTPLTPALVHVSALLDDPDTPELMLPGLEVVRRNIALEARLIDDLLDVTRISRGKLVLNRETVDSHDLIRRALEICHDDLAAVGHDVELELAAPSSCVDGDPARLLQVFWNLIKNAVKFTPKPGLIAIRSRNREGSSGTNLVVEVNDTGLGIAPEVLTKVFDAFEQGGPNMTRLFGGLGLGLAICRSLAEAHGGVLTATSPGQNEGATFTLELPTVPRPASSLPQTSASSPLDRAPRGTLRILLVEDNADTLRVMARLLRARGHRVTTAETLTAALDAVQGQTIDLIVSDVGLPDGTGLDLMRHLRAQSTVRGIALSGYGTDDDLRNSREAGFAAHLTKPIDFGVLDETIQRVSQTSDPWIGREDKD